MKKSSIYGLAFWVGLCLGAAFIGSLITAPAIPGWYQTLQKPDWTPPDWVFGPVWTALYTMMAIAAWRVWMKSPISRVPIMAFLAQLFLNVGWTVIFFGFKSPGIAFSEIIVLWAAILVTILQFRKVDRPACLLLVPYLTWVSYAAVLNYSIARLN